MLVQSNTSQRAIGPDVLRAVAILLVMSHHLPAKDLPWAFRTYWGQFGWLGVDIFFVLSGYLISTELLKFVQAGGRPDLVVFYIKRAFRILPAFWFVLALYFFLPILREAPPIAPAWRFLTFTMNFGLDYHLTPAFSHAWSLCVEEHFYLVLPLIFLALVKCRWRWLPVILATGIIVGGMALRHALWLDWKAHSGQIFPFMKAIYYPSYTRLDGLVMGSCLAGIRLFRADVWERLFRPVVALTLSFLFFAIAYILNFGNGLMLGEMGSVALYPAFGLGVTFLLAALLRLEARLRFLRWSGLPFVAMISYSLYLSQKLVFHADKLWLPHDWLRGWSGVAIYYGSAIIVAAAMYFTIERTSLSLRRIVLRKL